jgi:hypothetical protein
VGLCDYVQKLFQPVPQTDSASYSSRTGKSNSVFNAQQQYTVYGLNEKDSRSIIITATKQPSASHDSPAISENQTAANKQRKELTNSLLQH